MAEPKKVIEIACTLDNAERPARVNDWQSLLSRAVDRETVEGGMRVRFPHDPALAADIAGLAAAEQSCCSFFEFSLQLTSAGTILDVRAPAEAQDVVTALFA
jgi:hypothetical protein